MFKAKIRKEGERVLNCTFEDSDYPLLNLNFSPTSFKIEYLKKAVEGNTTAILKEGKPLLDIMVPEAVILKMSKERSINDGGASAYRTVRERLSPSIRNIISDILHCSFKPDLKKAYLTLKVAELLLQILSTQASKNDLHNWSERDRQSLEKVRDLLGQNLNANYSIEELAFVAGMNRTKLQDGFKTLFGKTIYTFSLDMKMTEAKALLTKQHNVSLKEIAAMLGYKHVNHFSVAFKKKFEISPSSFKKLLNYLLLFSFLFENNPSSVLCTYL